MFTAKLPSQARKYNKQRGSSARQWNDNSEFATPNLVSKEAGYLIDHNNVNDISSFNPFKAAEKKHGLQTKVK